MVSRRKKNHKAETVTVPVAGNQTGKQADEEGLPETDIARDGLRACATDREVFHLHRHILHATFRAPVSGANHVHRFTPIISIDHHSLNIELDTAKMVYYFTSNVVTPPGFIYVGKDKVESEYFGNWV